jgi:hypothetical protein
MGMIEPSAPFIDPTARIGITDLARQLHWYKAQGFVEKNVEARDMADLSLTAGVVTRGLIQIAPLPAPPSPETIL